MSTNKNASIRYRVLDRCFRSKKKFYIEDLIHACEEVLLEIDPNSNGVSLRQIRDDISFMKSADGWAIKLGDYRDGKRMYYRYEDPDFSINNMPLNDLDIEKLVSAFQILSQFKGMPQFEWVHELLPKLKVGKAPIATSKTMVEFDYNSDLKGIELFGDLYAHISGHKPLKVKYRPYGVIEPYDVVIHPYYLKHYNNRWFLFGYNPEKDKPDWNLPLDRIVSFKTSREKFIPNKVIDWDQYFDDIVGVTRPIDGILESVVLLFFGRTGYYIETNPLHRSQKPKWLDKDTFEVRLEVIINYELERLILSYADSVKVIHPESLTEVIANRLENGFLQYKKKQVKKL